MEYRKQFARESREGPRRYLGLGYLGLDTFAGFVLIASGLLHLFWLAAMGADWEGPLSPRKPALFGISAGVTVLSMVWVVKQLPVWRVDEWVSQLFAISLLVEVSLITLQFWRGEASHFNRSSPLNHGIELSMLVLIVLATLCVVWFTIRSHSALPINQLSYLALRAGLWLLLVSCGVGFLISSAAEMNLLEGRAPEIWGRNGVLKYPHGAAMHALQTLPLFAVCLEWLRAKNALRSLWALIWAHLLFLMHALWQTWHGRGRFEFDELGGILFAAAACSLMWSLQGIPLAIFIRLHAYIQPSESK